MEIEREWANANNQAQNVVWLPAKVNNSAGNYDVK